MNNFHINIEFGYNSVVLYEVDDEGKVCQTCAMQVRTLKKIKEFLCHYLFDALFGTGKGEIIIYEPCFLPDTYWEFEVTVSKEKLSIFGTPHGKISVYGPEAIECDPKDLIFDILDFEE